MKKILAVISILVIIAGCGKEDNKESNQVKPFDVITLDCKGVTLRTAAVLGIALYKRTPSSPNSLPPPQISFCYSRLPDPDVNDSIALELFHKSGVEADSTYISASIQRLDRNTTYYYRIFARTKEWIRYGEVKSFTTEEYSLKPVVDSVYNVGRDSVWIAWRVLTFEDPPYQQHKGVCYRLKSQVSAEFYNCYSYSFNDTTSSTIVRDLTPDTEYTASAFYEKYGHVVYGQEIVFKTKP